MQAAVDRVRDFWTALNAHIIGGGTWTVDGTVDLIDQATGELGASVVVTSRTGSTTLAGDPLPYQTQGLVAWSTATVIDGHRLRGHTYVPAPCETDNTGAVPVAAYVAALNTASAALLAAGVLGLHIWHRPVFDASGALVRSGGSGPVTAGAGRGTWSVLRSRRS